MKIIVAKTGGFCMGVRRAVDMVLQASTRNSPPIYTYGPLIHNPQVLSILNEKGISVMTEIPEKGEGTVLIRAHGVPPETQQRLQDAGFKVLNATCPHVIKVQTIIRRHTRKGYASIIIGDRDHPEVVGLMGYANGKGCVAADIEGLSAIPLFEKGIVVAQTTQNSRLFQEIQAWARDNAPHYKIFNTICNATDKRQAEVRQIADSVDAVVVVGGHNSGNTTRLAQIVRESGKPVYHVETEEELPADAFASVQTVGITAGASTPQWIIKKVYRSCEGMLLKNEKSWRVMFFNLQRTLLWTSIYLALGAGSICYTGLKLQGFDYLSAPVLVSMLYIISMHTFNHLTGRKADRFNDPDRAAFYRSNRGILTALAVAAGAAGLAIASYVGPLAFLILLLMSVLGISYNLRLVPKQLHTGRYRRIRDIPGSKTVLIALGWGLVTSIVPSIMRSGAVPGGTLLVFLWSASLVFVRTAFFDILDIHGDRITGRETFPIVLGEASTMRLLKGILVLNMGVLFFSSLLGWISPLGFVLMLVSFLLYLSIAAYEQSRMSPGIGLEFLIESHLVLTGVLGWLSTLGS
jgi:4-hydroxy-3-methylbut-2-enyl diphosphate reductase